MKKLVPPSFPPSKHPSKKAIRSLIAFSLVLVAVLTIGLRPFYWITSRFHQAGSVVTSLLDDAGPETTLLLQERIAMLEGKVRDLEALLHLSDSPLSESEPARVIAKTITDQHARMLLDKGREDGVEVGMGVVVQDHVLVGRVERVEARRALVQLITDREFRVTSTLSTQQLVGVSEGARGALLRLNFIPQEAVVEVGMTVHTAGLEARMAGGLLLGVITGVEEEPNAPFQIATIEPIVDARLLTH